MPFLTSNQQSQNSEEAETGLHQAGKRLASGQGKSNFILSWRKEI